MNKWLRYTFNAAAVFALAAGLSVGITACGDSDREKNGNGAADSAAADGPAIVDDSVVPDSQEVCEASAYIGDISALPEGMQTVLRERFPYHEEPDAADIIFCSQDEYDRSADLQKNWERGAVIIIVKPESNRTPRKLDLISAGSAPELSDNDQSDNDREVLFYAFFRNNKQYTVYGGSSPDGGVSWEDMDEDAAEAYHNGRVTPLVHWLNNEKFMMLGAASPGDAGYDYDSLVTNIENEGISCSANFPFSLHEACGKCYVLQAEHKIDAESSFDVSFKVYPLYMQSCNGDKAGDYYAVTCAVTPYNQNMWRTWHCSTGLFSEVYMVGYWFKHMATTIRLLDKNGTPISGVKYYRTPVPENAINSRNYSNGTSDTFSGSVSGGITAGKPVGSVTASFSHTVNSSVSYTMDDIDYTLDSSTNQPHYDYDSKNVKPSKSSDWDRYWPKNCRTQWTVRQSWIWFVPRGTAGVDDNKDTSFKLSFDGLLQYCNYSWMYVPVDVDQQSEVRTFTPVWVKTHTWDLPAPDRRTWGMVTIKNAANNALSNIKFFRKGEEDKEPAARLDMSYNVGEVAEIALPEGEYTITFETIDPDKDNQKLADWMFENVTVKQGRNKAAATTALSSVNAKKIE